MSNKSTPTPEGKKRILIVGDSPTVPSGFGLCTRQLCRGLESTGKWDIHVLGINFDGDSNHDYNFPIYLPASSFNGGRDPLGFSRFPLLYRELEPDVTMFLNDPWNIAEYFEAFDDLQKRLPKDEKMKEPLSIGWIAIDGENQQPEQLDRLNLSVVWTKFALDELSKDKVTKSTITVVPLGVDLTEYYPCNSYESRMSIYDSKIILDENTFLIGVVGRNQIRKKLELAIESYAKFLEMKSNHSDEKIKNTDCYLVLHVAPTGDSGCDIKRLVEFFGVSGKVILNNPPLAEFGPEGYMRNLYNSFDVLLSTSQGEGFGLPILEALACGTPCVVPDYSGLGSWTQCFDGCVNKDESNFLNLPIVERVPTNNISLYSPYWGPYVIGKLVDTDVCASHLFRRLASRVEPNLQFNSDIVHTITDNCLEWDQVISKMIALTNEVANGNIG